MRTMVRPLLCLTAIVKDEAHCIARTLESVRGVIDCFAILDTGSTDGTQAIVRNAPRGLPGALCEEPFVDFATSRNRALELAGTDPVFTLMVSADEVVVSPEALRVFLESRRE